MRTLIILACSVLTITWSGCSDSTASAAKPTIDLATEAAKLDSTFLAEYNSGDVDGVMSLYWNSPSLRAYGPSGDPIQGYTAFRELLVRDFNMFKGATLSYTNTENLVFDDVVIGHGTFNWTMPVSADSSMTTHGRYTEVKAVKDGKLVIIVDHVSVPMHE